MVGSGLPWQSARAVLCDLSYSAFRVSPEPSEAFEAALQQEFSAASKLLADIPEHISSSIAGHGIAMDVLLDLAIDQGQLDLNLPTLFLAQVARLKLRLRVLTND